MKNQQFETASTFTPLESDIQSSSHLLKPLCPSNFQAKFICLNPKCNGTSKTQDQIKNGNFGNFFICSNSSCTSCFEKQAREKISKIAGVHSKCFVGDYESLINCIEQKKKSSEPLKNAINTIIDNLIDQLSDLRQKYINKLKFYGLTEIQQKFLESFQKHNYHEITSKKCFKIVQQLDFEPSVNGSMAKTKLQEYWQKSNSKIQKIFQHFDTIISSSSPASFLDLQSKIVTQQKDKLNLFQMLEENEGKSIQSLTFLYRASQSNFDTDAFHEKCDKIPGTVTLLETEFGNKIGGYTPLIWDKAGNNRIDRDPNSKTFLFNLTHKHKFTLKPNHEAAILQYSNAGPTFGSGPSDIYIKNKANTISIYGNIGNTYVNSEYVAGDQKSWTKFSGATTGKEFKVKEWEVFQVKWIEKV